MPFRHAFPTSRRLVATGVASLLALALLVAAVQAVPTGTATPAAAHGAQDLQREQLRTLSSLPSLPPADDTRSIIHEGLKGGDYVVAQAGIREAPEPTPTAEPEPAPTTEAASSGGAYTSPDGQYTYEHSIQTWERLAQCESNGDWSINTGNGYYGGIQFNKSSWDMVGGAGYPHENSKWEQIHRGELLHDRQGWGAWPACSRKLGLR